MDINDLDRVEAQEYYHEVDQVDPEDYYIEFETYSQQWTEGMTYSTDDPIQFRVPKEWAIKKIWDNFGMTLKTFLLEYTYDHSEILLLEAREEGVDLHVSRPE